MAANTAAEAATTAPSLHGESSYLGASKLYAGLLFILASIGMLFSGVIMADKVKLLMDPTFVPACTLSDVISCSDVMQSPQAAAFGFPNPILGLIGFPVVMTIAVLLFAGLKLPRWFWVCSQIGMIAAVLFIHWLAYQAIFNIFALCLYCMAVWAVTMPAMFMILIQPGFAKRAARGEQITLKHWIMPVLVLLAWYIGMALIIWMQFWM